MVGESVTRWKLFGLLISLVAVAVVGIGGCSDDDGERLDLGGGPFDAAGLEAGVDGGGGDGPPTDTGGANNQAQMMAIHASPDAPGVNLSIDGKKVNSAPLTFGNNTGYLSVTAGKRKIEITPATGGNAVLTAEPTLDGGKSYSVFVTNTLTNIESVTSTDDLTVPAAGKAKIRVAHMSPDAPAVDVGVQGGSNVFTDVAFKDVEEFKQVDPGTVTLEIKRTGTSTVVLSVPNVKLDAGKIYTVVALDNVAQLMAKVIVNN